MTGLKEIVTESVTRKENKVVEIAIFIHYSLKHSQFRILKNVILKHC